MFPNHYPNPLPNLSSYESILIESSQRVGKVLVVTNVEGLLGL
jgi:hypothetical protein